MGIDTTREDLDETYGARRTGEEEMDAMPLFEPHEHSWVHPLVAVGSFVHSFRDMRKLRDAGITHVINCAELNLDMLYEGSGITCVHLPTRDDSARKDFEWFLAGAHFALRALRASSMNRVMVHCMFGISRGPSMAYAVLRALNMEPDDAFKAIVKARPKADVCYAADAERAAKTWTNRMLDR